MRTSLALPIAGLLALPLLPAAAEACQGGRTVAFGETVAQVAARCGVNPQALRQVNPGLNDSTIRAGQMVQVPPRALPSPQLGHGRSQVTVQPPIATSPGIGVRVPQPAPPPQLHRPAIERPLIGHMPSILDQPF